MTPVVAREPNQRKHLRVLAGCYQQLNYVKSRCPLLRKVTAAQVCVQTFN